MDGPPRRALFAADPVTHSWAVTCSTGWPTQAAAEEAVWRLDTDGASIAIDDFAGFFAFGAGSWLIVRGWLAPSPNETRRYWREAVALEDADFARVRFNPFRLLPARLESSAELPGATIPPPSMPEAVDMAADLKRLEQLDAGTRTAGRAADRENLLAAVLEAEHTLVSGALASYDEVELLTLLLPPRSRTRLTFHSRATALPGDPVPRLVLARQADARALQVAPIWGHRLPATERAIEPRARRAAAGLLDLLGALDLLAAAHEAFGAPNGQARSAPGRHDADSRSLLDDVEAVLRLARPPGATPRAETEAALRVLERAAALPSPVAEPDDPDEVFRRLSPERIGAALVRQLHQSPASLERPAAVMERFFARRREHADEFDAFMRPLEGGFDPGELTARDADARRIRTLLMLQAAARADAGGVADALVLPMSHDVIARVGGLAAWLPATHDRIADAVLALASARTPDNAGDALSALAVLAREVEQPPRRARLAHAGLDFMRWAYRHAPADEWDAALPIADAGAELFRTAAAAGTVRLETRLVPGRARMLPPHRLPSQPNPPYARGGVGGRAWDAEAAAAEAAEAATSPDADLFFGFLGVDGSPRRPEPADIASRGDAIAAEVAALIHDGSPGDEAGEAVHWSMALLERVRRGEVEHEFAPLATRLLHLLANDRGAGVLRAYVERHAVMRRWALDQPSPGSEADEGRRAAPGSEAGEGRRAAPGSEAGEGRRAAPRSESDEARRAARGSAVAEARHTAPGSEGVSPSQRVAAPEGMAGDRPRSAADHAQRSARNAAERRRLLAVAASVLIIGTAIALWASGLAGWAVAAAGVRDTTVLAVDWIRWRGVLAGRIDGELERARHWATLGEWDQVVDLLSRRTPVGEGANAFAWDSLLASAALRQADRFDPGDARRAPLLVLSVDRSSRALETVPPFAPGTDPLRLLRAEACLAATAGCDPASLIEDLLLAARSASPDVSLRALEILAALRS